MERVLEAVEAQDYGRLVTICEELEFEVAASFGSTRIDVQELYPVFIAGYLILNDLNSARFLHQRLPEQLKNDTSEIKAIWQVGSAMWQHQYSAVYLAIEQFKWSPVMAQLVLALSISIRERTFALITDAYSSITVQAAAEYMGMTLEQVVAVATERGWVHDATNQILQPVKSVPPPDQSTGLNGFSRVADVVVHLEKP